MAIETYLGVPGFAVDIEEVKDVYNALDSMHSQVMDAFPDESSEQMDLLNILEESMQKVDAAFPNVDFW